MSETYLAFLRPERISLSDFEFFEFGLDSAASSLESDDDESESDDSSDVEEDTGDIFFTVTD